MIETELEKEEKTEEEKAETEAIVKTSENSEMLKTALVFGQSETNCVVNSRSIRLLNSFVKSIAT